MDSDMLGIQTTNSRMVNMAKARASAKHLSNEKLDEVASDFEANFISQMLENMFSTVDTKGALGGNDSEDVYRSMLVDEYGKVISRAGGIGVADHVKRQMLQLQEV